MKSESTKPESTESLAPEVPSKKSCETTKKTTGKPKLNKISFTFQSQAPITQYVPRHYKRDRTMTFRDAIAQFFKNRKYEDFQYYFLGNEITDGGMTLEQIGVKNGSTVYFEMIKRSPNDQGGRLTRL